MRLSIYLFRDGASNFTDLLRAPKPNQPGPKPLQLKQAIGVPCEAWIVADKKTPPSWADVVAPLVSAKSLWNVSNSLVLLLEVKQRFFTVTFGYGQAILEHDLLESEFGLRCTANAADPGELGAIQVRTLSENSRQQRSQTTNRTGVADFNLEVEREMVRYLKGDVMLMGAPAKSLAGSQSLSLTTDKPLTDLPAILEWTLDRFGSNDYKSGFPYLDNFVPLSQTDPIIGDLDKLLLKAISSPAGAHLGVASPDDILGDEVDRYKVSGDRRRGIEFDELKLDDVLDRIAGSPSTDPLSDLKITPLNANDVPVRPARRLRDYFVFQMAHQGSTFVLCLGRWYKIDSSYVKQIDKRIAKIHDVTSALNLSAWKKGDEGKYNAKEAKSKKWLLLDKKNFPIGGPHQKVEIADMITADGDFICVKKMSSSATLSHLFSQAAVSADLFSMDAEGYAQHVHKLFSTRWKGILFPNQPMMVMAIATDKKGSLADSLFFFSKVNLVQRQREIERAGFIPALAKIER